MIEQLLFVRYSSQDNSFCEALVESMVNLRFFVTESRKQTSLSSGTSKEIAENTIQQHLSVFFFVNVKYHLSSVFPTVFVEAQQCISDSPFNPAWKWKITATF